MIQLRRAKFENFRLLRDIEITFSTDFEKPLTVIRAENDTGKTTLLSALTWGLFGDEALPGARSTFRLHPIDWDIASLGGEVPVKVTIDFAVLDEDSGREIEYELERFTTEHVGSDNQFRVQQAQVMLLEHTSAGVEPVENPNARIHSLIPPHLKDIFFIDGDRALAFIEATDEQRIKRDRVAKAVRALLGLDLLEDGERHVDKARQDAVSNIRKLGAGTDIERLAEQTQDLESKVAQLQADERAKADELDATETRHRKADKHLKEALAAGAGEEREIGRRLESDEAELDRERKSHAELVAAHRRLLNLPTLTVALAPGPVATAAALLADLEERKVIPSTLPNVIEDRLEREECLCGTSLAPGTEARAHLEKLFEDALDIDESKDLLRYLNDAVKRTLREAQSEDNWATRLKESQAAIHRSIQKQNLLEETVGELRVRIQNLGKTNLETLEGLVAQEEKEVKRLIGERARIESSIKALGAQMKDLERERSTAERANAKVQSGVAREQAAKDVLRVIRSTIGVLQGETIDEVSDRMNSIFLKMIVADEDAGSVVKKVTLTRTHDILVEGPGGRTIDPDIDLNGASRRALTLAFILALVKVSGVQAPNIIDTPLGMMGVEVRQAVLKYAAMHSSQLVMFLTGSEVLGVEELLDSYAGRVYTFSNSAHFPTKLLNDPGTGRTETLACDCNHRTDCDLCRRRTSLRTSMAAS